MIRQSEVYLFILLSVFVCNMSFSGERPASTASYYFANNLKAQEANVAALKEINPLNKSKFLSDVVFGSERIVYRFDGNKTAQENAGLSLSTNGLFVEENQDYSIEMIVQLDASEDYINLFSLTNRKRDSGFYVLPDQSLEISPFSGNEINEATNKINFGQYHHIILTVKSTATENIKNLSVYLDGSLVLRVARGTLNLNAYTENPEQIMDFFVDNIEGGANGEDSNGKVALVRLYNKALVAEEVETITQNPFNTLECASNYNSGRLSIPCVAVSSDSEDIIFDTKLEIVTDFQPLSFGLIDGRIRTLPINSDYKCLARVQLDGALTIPCVYIQGIPGISSTDSYEVNMQYNNLSDSISFKFIDAN